jgi:hypothetical protein
MSYQIQGLSPEPFLPLYGLSDAALLQRCAKRYTADTKPGFPDRIELRDVEPGETVILVNHVHQGALTPYHASHAIFVREGAEFARVFRNEIPEVLRSRAISLRAFDAEHWMIDAELVAGTDLEASITNLLANPQTQYLQAHFAQRGCYAARITRGSEATEARS